MQCGDGQGWCNNQWGESPLEELSSSSSFFLLPAAISHSSSSFFFLSPTQQQTHVRTSLFFFLLPIPYSSSPLPQALEQQHLQLFLRTIFKRFIHLAATTVSGSLLRIASTGASVFQQLLSLSLSTTTLSAVSCHSSLVLSFNLGWFIFLLSIKKRKDLGYSPTTPSCLTNSIRIHPINPTVSH